MRKRWKEGRKQRRRKRESDREEGKYREESDDGEKAVVV